MGASQQEKDAYKLMRRGTRACRECRRRKVKCIYDDDDDNICQECKVHNRHCIKQGIVRGSSDGGTSKSVKVQVTRLESAVEKLAREDARTKPTPPTIGSPQEIPTSPQELEKLQEKHQNLSPIFSLFNNDLIRQNGSLDPYATEFTTLNSFPDTNLSDKDKLLSTIANVPAIYDVLKFASVWWISWREQHFALRKSAGLLTLAEFVQNKLSSDSPASVSIGLLAIAMALGQLRPGVDDLSFNLPVPANHIMNYILAGIDQVVCNTDKYHAEADSVLLFMMRAKHHTENNQLRKAWLRIRQAIACAQSTEFSSIHKPELSLTEEQAEQQRFVASIFEIDHLISMVLGLPYAKDPAFTDTRAFMVLLDPSTRDESLKMRAMRRILAITAARINDRNASGQSLDDFADSTQATLTMAANAMPTGWWNLLSEPMSGLAAHRYESVMVQLWFWTVQTYLHLPYLIQNNLVGPTARYRELAMEGARNLLRSFIYLRSEPSISVFMCNCDDFQALLGSCILIVGILQNADRLTSTPPVSPVLFGLNSLQESIDADLGLIEEIKDIFRYRMTEQGGSISKQGLSVIEELTSFVYDDEDVNGPTVDVEGGIADMGMLYNRHMKTIMLPYFGTIRVELTKKLPKRRHTSIVSQPLPTPPTSIDESFTDSSSFSHQTPERAFNSQCEAPLIGLETALTGLPSLNPDFNYPNYKNFDPPLDAYPMASPEDIYLETQIPPIAWDQWENYMFDQELNQEWNPAWISDGIRCDVAR